MLCPPTCQGIRLRRRFTRPAPDKQACRSSVGECEPALVALRQTGSKVSVTPTIAKGTVCTVPYLTTCQGIRLRRRFTRPAPDKQACRSSVGECEPALVALRQTGSKASVTPTIAKGTALRCLLLWSEWQDSNLRPLGPEQIRHRFLTTFVDFLVLFSPKTMLSDALVRTVST